MAQSSDALQLFRPETVRGAPGFFRVGQTRAGSWWLIDAQNQPFFACAVSEVAESETGEPDAVERLRGWGFNTLGAASRVARFDTTMPFIGVVDFCGAGGLIQTGGARLPDVFDPAWPARATAHAPLVCGRGGERREMIGWLADDTLSWARAEVPGRPSLLQICLSLEPGFAAYHAAWEFVLASRGGRVADLARAWGHPFANKEVVREMTRAEQGIATRGYLRDNARWTREFAQRYFATTSAAIRACDPNHLVMGARELRDAAAGPAIEPDVAGLEGGGFPMVDLPWVHWSGLATAPIGPVFAGDFTWVTADIINGPAVLRGRGLTTVERMLKRGRGSLQRTIAHPSVVGYAWRQWRDRAGEQPPFAGGLVHANGREAREHTELVGDIHLRLTRLRPFSVSSASS